MLSIEKFASYTFFPGQHWGHTWERQHELTTRLSKIIKKDVYIFPPLGLINHNPFKIAFFRKVLNRFQSQSDATMSRHNSVEKNMIFVNSIFVPWHNRIIGKLNYHLLKRKICFSDQNFFWSTYMNPTTYEFFKRSKFKVYDLAERRSRNPIIPQYIKGLERKAIKEADIVFVDNYATLEDYKELNPNIIYVPQGVNVESFFKINGSDKKYIGYIGNLHFAIDYSFLKKLIELNCEEKFLLVGAVMEKEAMSILSLPNVIHVPQVSKGELNEYLAEMKVGLIPYLINDVTVGVYPTKLFEYLAAGVPVISTALPEVVQYKNDSYLKIISEPSFLLLDFDMKDSLEIVKENTWDIRWEKYLNQINQCLK